MQISADLLTVAPNTPNVCPVAMVSHASISAANPASVRSAEEARHPGQEQLVEGGQARADNGYVRLDHRTEVWNHIAVCGVSRLSERDHVFQADDRRHGYAVFSESFSADMIQPEGKGHIQGTEAEYC
jgi:hypothetical protein